MRPPANYLVLGTVTPAGRIVLSYIMQDKATCDWDTSKGGRCPNRLPREEARGNEGEDGTARSILGAYSLFISLSFSVSFFCHLSSSSRLHGVLEPVEDKIEENKDPGKIKKSARGDNRQIKPSQGNNRGRETKKRSSVSLQSRQPGQAVSQFCCLVFVPSMSSNCCLDPVLYLIFPIFPNCLFIRQAAWISIFFLYS